MRLGLPIIASLLFTAAPAAAQAEPAPSDPPAAKPVKEKKICRRQVPTGRRIAESICLARSEWDRLDAASAEAARGFTDEIVRHAGVAGAARNPVTGQ